MRLPVPHRRGHYLASVALLLPGVFPFFWMLPGVLIGYLINWYWVAPRLRRLSLQEDWITLTDVFAKGHSYGRVIAAICSFIVLFSFSFYIASQFQAAGSTFSSSFGLGANSSIILGGTIILVYTLLGGFWAVSVTDTIQGILMALTALLLPLLAIIAVGGVSGLISGLEAANSPQMLSWTGAHSGIVAVGFILGSLGIGLANPGQPHVVNRFMALRDEQAVRQARVISLFWAVVVFAGMMVLGLCGKALVQQTSSNEQIFFVMTGELLSPVLAGVVIAAVLSAIMSTADSQLLVCASSIAHDLKRDQSEPSLWLSRAAVCFMCVIAVLLAIYAPQSIFTRVLFAWTALGAAFGPLLIVRLMSFRVSQNMTIASIVSGFLLTVIFHLQASPPGDYWERFVPLMVAFVFAWWGREKNNLIDGIK